MSVFAGVWSEPILVGRDVGIYPNIDNQGVCWLTCGRSTYRFDEGTSNWQKVTESGFYGGAACFDKGDTLRIFCFSRHWTNQLKFSLHFGVEPVP